MTSEEKHHYTVGEARALTEAERPLLVAMLGTQPALVHLIGQVHQFLVQDMNDGGMGSLRFVGPEDRRFGSVAVEACFADEDGIPVSVAVILDQNGALFELDVFKGDGSPLISLPPCGTRQNWSKGSEKR